MSYDMFSLNKDFLQSFFSNHLSLTDTFINNAIIMDRLLEQLPKFATISSLKYFFETKYQLKISILFLENNICYFLNLRFFFVVKIVGNSCKCNIYQLSRDTALHIMSSCFNPKEDLYFMSLRFHTYCDSFISMLEKIKDKNVNDVILEGIRRDICRQLIGFLSFYLINNCATKHEKALSNQIYLINNSINKMKDFNVNKCYNDVYFLLKENKISN